MNYFTRIEEELNKTIMTLIENMLEAAKEKEWEAILLSCGAIMDNVKSIYPQAAGNLHRIISGKTNGNEAEEFFN